MKFVKSSLAKKIIILLVAIICYNAIFPVIVHANVLDDVMDSIGEAVGGLLLNPIIELAAWLIGIIDGTIGALLINQSLTPGSLEEIEDLLKAVGDSTKLSADKGSPFFDVNGVPQKLVPLLIGPDSLFAGQVPLVNANIFNYDNFTNYGSIGLKVNLQKAVAYVYNMIRNICGIIMLAGLIYTGIQILLSANIPSQQGRYKLLLQDWIMGMVLLIFSHVIMVVVFEISDAVVKSIRDSLLDGSMNGHLLRLIFGNSVGYIPKIPLLGMLVFLLWLTVVYGISYLKRLLWIQILVVFAPVFAVMYSFGNQTKQLYSKWLKEFIMYVLIQPYHMIIYYGLVMIPVNAVANAGDWDLFTIFYALVAIWFIRPAEEYLKQMFGFNQGLANQASYSSGLSTMVAAAQAVSGVRTALGGEDGFLAKRKAASDAIKFAESSKEIETKEPPKQIEWNDDNDDLGDRNAEWSGGFYSDVENERSWENEKIDSSASNGWEDAKGYLQFQAVNQGYDTVADMRKDLGSSGITDMLNEGGYHNDDLLKTGSSNNNSTDDGSEVVAELNEAQMAAAQGKDSDGKDVGEINASNVTLNAGAVNLQGDIGTNGTGGPGGANTTNGPDNSTGGTNGNSGQDGGADNKTNDSQMELSDGKLTRKDKKQIRENVGYYDARKKLRNAIAKGASGIGGTFYATTPPNDRGAFTALSDQGIARNEATRKAEMDRAKNSWANDKVNVDKMTQKRMPEMREIYKGKTEAYIQMKAEEKAKSDLAKMSEFVPYGITDVDEANSLYKDQKKYGFTPQQAISNQVGYDKFNKSTININAVNKIDKLSGAGSFKSVEDAFPNAKDYYSNGFQTVNEMASVDLLVEKLKVSPEFAMKMQVAIDRKGGNIEYSGQDKEIKKQIDDLNKGYKKFKKNISG